MLSLHESRVFWWKSFWPTYRRQCCVGSAVLAVALLGLGAWVSQAHPDIWRAAVPVLRAHAWWLGVTLPWVVVLMPLPITLAITGPYPTWAQHKKLVAFKQTYDQLHQPEAN